jgi:hypothetical protein
MDKIKAISVTKDRVEIAQREIWDRLLEVTKDNPEIMDLLNDYSVMSFSFYCLHFMREYPHIRGFKTYLERLITKYIPKDQSKQKENRKGT